MIKLHIALVTETYPPEINGVAMTLSRWVDGLIALGHSLEIWRPEPIEQSPPRMNGCITEHRVRGFAVPQYPDLRFGQPAGRKLAARWRMRRPDVLYVATEGPLGWSALRAAQQVRIPVVSGFHTRFDCYSPHYHLAPFLPLVRSYLRRFHRKTHLTLAPTAQLRKTLEDDGFGNIAVIPRGVDTRLFDPQRRNPRLRRQWGLADDALAVLYVGRLAREKNLDEVLDAFRAIQEDHLTARLILVGDGPLRDTLAHDNPDIICTGMQRDTALAEHYASADLFLFPSRTETFGNVTLEAMASGLPVVAYDDAAAKLHIRHRSSGMLAPETGISYFTDMACELAGDVQLRRRLGNAAREHAGKIDWEHVVLDLEALLIRCAHSQPH
ncbi:MAG: glycosyltransferase family 1 protein [Gammaproteobacteria bacterium]|nr:glycosyltransferase family 1 protein [Gammaproteobacteria bacterium]